MEQETWATISNYEGYYEISTFGRTKSLARIIVTIYNGKERLRKIQERIRKTSLHDHGYLQVALNKLGGMKTFFVHRLVAEAFIPNPCGLPEVNHKNGIKIDNFINNLEWVTTEGNNKHSITTGLFHNVGEKHGMSKLTDSDIPVIKRRLQYGETCTTIAKDYQVSRKCIGLIKTQQTWKHVA